MNCHNCALKLLVFFFVSFSTCISLSCFVTPDDSPQVRMVPLQLEIMLLKKSDSLAVDTTYLISLNRIESQVKIALPVSFDTTGLLKSETFIEWYYDHYRDDSVVINLNVKPLIGSTVDTCFTINKYEYSHGQGLVIKRTLYLDIQ